MDGDPIGIDPDGLVLLSARLSAGLTGAQVCQAIHELAMLAARELTPPAGEPLERHSWVEGAVYTMLWLSGVKDQTPTAYLASCAERGTVR